MKGIEWQDVVTDDDIDDGDEAVKYAVKYFKTRNLVVADPDSSNCSYERFNEFFEEVTVGVAEKQLMDYLSVWECEGYLAFVDKSYPFIFKAALPCLNP